MDELSAENHFPKKEVELGDSKNDGIFIKSISAECQTQHFRNGGWSKIFRAYIAPPSSEILKEMELKKMAIASIQINSLMRRAKSFVDPRLTAIQRHGTMK
jgi:hypothetical protein